MRSIAVRSLQVALLLLLVFRHGDLAAPVATPSGSRYEADACFDCVWYENAMHIHFSVTKQRWRSDTC